MDIFEKKSGMVKSFDNTPVYYESRGKGEAIIFVYGLACVMNHWHHQVKYFAKKFNVVTFDIRGHHQSNPITEIKNINIYSIAKDIKILLEELHIKKAHFVGHSFGSPVILAIYDLFPEIFLSITLINGFSKNPFSEKLGINMIEVFFNSIKSQYEKSPVLFTQIWKWIVYNHFSMRVMALVGGFNLRLTHFKDIEVYAKGVAELDLKIFLRLFEDMMQFSGDHILSKINAPTLIISGENDHVTPRVFQEEMHTKINNSQFVLIPYGSHCTQLDFPDYVNLKIQSFLDQIS